MKTKNRTIAFLYLLMRDQLTPGKMEAIMEQLEKATDTEFDFTNEFLALYAEELHKRLNKDKILNLAKVDKT